MNRRRLSLPILEPNQPGITQFIERTKDYPIKFIGARRPSQASATRTNTPTNSPSANSVTKKRTRPVLFSSTERRPNKCQALNMENNNQTTVKHVNGDPEKLNLELGMLKKQLFAGFELMIESLKNDIKQLQTERRTEAAALCVETVNRKFLLSESKQKKIEDRLSIIEDQLLEKNLIFQGLHKTEYKDKNDIKGQVIRAISNTMPGEDLDEKRTNAECTSIDQVERLGRYNPLRSRPVKMKFTDKSDVDHLLKNKRMLP